MSAAASRRAISARLPVFAAPMFLVSGPDLVIAACRAGIVGCFPSHNARTADDLAQWMERMTSELAQAREADPNAVIAPWCVNLVTHSTNARLPDDLALVAKYKPAVVVTALGSPRPVMEVVKSYGGIVIADVINMTLARKAIAAGVDGLACVSAGAGGHTGFLSPFAFISAVRAIFDGIITVGGGISDGRGVAGAIAAGADFVYMGTRFIPTVESLAPQGFKQMVVDSTIDDLVVSAAISGTPASWLKPSLLAAGLDPGHLGDTPERAYDTRNSGAKRWKDLWAAGQGIDASKAIEPVATIVNQLEGEYKDALRAMAARLEVKDQGKLK
ncbi:MAG: NAD(P)H-dependent flavin oxidoreductase [Dehalococcoidia bacterium]